MGQTILEEMQKIKEGDVVLISIEEGHVIFDYKLKVYLIEPYKENGEVIEIIAYGKGVTEEDAELAEEFTHRIDAGNFVEIVNEGVSQ